MERLRMPEGMNVLSTSNIVRIYSTEEGGKEDLEYYANNSILI